MRSTMRTITNVSYDGRAVDIAAESTLTFTNNCDSLSHIRLNFRDMDSGVTSTWAMNGAWQRGQTVAFDVAGKLSAGHDYICVPTVYQSAPNAGDSETSPGLYDVYMGAGRVQADSETAGEVYIDRDISFFRAPVESGGKLLGGCVLKLSDRDLLIRSYDPETGLATVETARINGTTYAARTTAQGEKYKLITNYLLCDAFVFYARTTPAITLETALTADGIAVTGTYSQAQGVALQSWRMWAEYKTETINSVEYTMEHETQYTQTIADSFPPIVSDGTLQTPAAVDICCEVTSQDGQTAQAKVELRYSTESFVEVQARYGDITVTSGLPENSRFFVWRQENFHQSEHDDDDDVLNWAKLKYIGSSDSVVYTAEQGYRTTYRYLVCGVDSEGGLHYGVSADVAVTGRFWSIEHLTKTGYRTYRADGTRFEFTVDVQPSAIETVTGSAVYGSEGQYPKYIHGTDRYDTGSFTALLGSITAVEASHSRIQTWAEFIAQAGPFLLKTDVGDVKIVAITGNPARQYGASLAELGITRVTCSWAEVDDIMRAVIR